MEAEGNSDPEIRRHSSSGSHLAVCHFFKHSEISIDGSR